MGPIDSVVPLEFGFLTVPQRSLPALALDGASVILIVSLVGENQYRGALLIEAFVPGQANPIREVFNSVGNGSIDDGLLVMNLRSSQGTLIQIQSDDVDDTTNVGLHPVISFDLYDLSSGFSQYRGRVNSMEGFGVN